MPYSVTNNLIGGVDRSRPIYALDPGVMYDGINGHLTRGGDFEKRKAFVEYCTLPDNTFGFERASGGIYVFGSDPAPTMPQDILYQRLQHPDGFAMTDILATDVFAGEIYAIAKFSNGDVLPFYNGTLVSDWTDGVVRASMVDNAGIAEHLRALLAANTKFAVTRSSNVITIEHNTTNTPFTLTTETINGGSIDDQTAAVATVTAAAVGVKEKKTITIAGTFDVGDRFGVLLDATPYGSMFNPTGTQSVCRTHGRKMYVGGGRLVTHSGVDNARLWNREDDAGAGFFDVSVHESDSEEVTALGKYLSYLAVFSENVTQVWDVRADETLNTPVQSVFQTGTRSPRSTLNFGQLDLFYLANSGIRSLRVRQQVNLAGVTDVGSPIDSLVVSQMRGLTNEQIKAACSVVDPIDGRYWLAVGDKIFVFTFFQEKKVVGWTWYEPNIEFTHFVVRNQRIYGRSSDGKVYIYGGINGDTYDSCPVRVLLPFFAAAKAGTHKRIVGVDIGATGTWKVKFLVNPNDLNEYVDFGELTGFTFGKENTAGMAEVTHWAPLCEHEAPGYASLSSIGQFYEGARSES